MNIFSEEILTPLYLFINSVSALAFLPQIIRLLMRPEARVGISRWAFSGFCFASLVSVLYAVFVADDGPMAFAMGLFLAGNVSVLLTSLLPKRYYIPAFWKRRSADAGSAGAKQDAP